MPAWYYLQNGQQVGPVSEERLRALFDGGQIGPDHLVWREGMPEWAQARVAGLVPATPPPVPKQRFFQQALFACRAALGQPPRQLGVERFRPPPFLKTAPNNYLWEIYRQQESLFRQGLVVWGHIVQANNNLFKAGPYDHPASIIYSTDSRFDDQPHALESMAASLFAVKGKRHPDPEMAEFSRVLADEHDPAPRLPVPRSLTGGYAVFHTAIIVVRQHLPQGYLTHSLFPLLIEAQLTTAAIIVPCRFWPPGLVAMWSGS